MKSQPKSAVKRSRKTKWASPHKKRGNIPLPKQASVVALHLTGAKQRAISRELGLDRETVARILSQQETQHLLQGYRDAVLKIVPKALVGLYHLVGTMNERAIIETLYGARVLVQRQETEEIQEPKRDYSFTKVEFFAKHGRWPLDKELKAFEKTLDVKPLVKELSE